MKRIDIIAVTVALATLAPALASAQHPLAEAASEMEPGEWRELTTENLHPVLDSDYGALPEYADNGAWDPVTEQLFYIGQGHTGGTGTLKMARYRAADNRWDELFPSWRTDVEGVHGYDHSAIDVERRRYYHRPFQFDVVYAWDIDAETWSPLPAMPGSRWSACCGGLAYHPEMDALLFVGSGSVWIYRHSTSTWEVLESGVTMGEYHNFAEYSPGANIMIFGGGNGGEADGPGSRALHRLEADGAIRRLEDAPVPLGTLGSVLTHDPASDVFVVLSDDGLRTYDAAADAWSAVSADVPVPVFNTIATPLSNYGVIMYVTWFDESRSGVYLYKNAPFTPAPAPDPATGDDGGLPMTGDGGGAPDAGAGAPDASTGPPMLDDGDPASGGCTAASGAPTGVALSVLALLLVVRRRSIVDERRQR